MIKLVIKAFALLLVVLAVSCDTKKIETSRQLFAKEQERLNTFLNTVPHDSVVSNPDKLNWKEYWTRQAVDTIDKSLETGLIYFEKETGTGDVVTVGKEVGIYYYRSVIGTYEDGEVGLSEPVTNYGTGNPLIFVVGGQSGVQPGIEEAVTYMRKYGKSKVIIPSLLDNKQYQTAIYDIEVTYLSK
ncbi:FKBP-type peptidyl-prolyl cis-trans isomerase [Saccharicrinis carchari]|nr:FKBP-type peptidyl-prolyl cis-trans isomerase [Saccharicrinis carchari]